MKTRSSQPLRYLGSVESSAGDGVGWEMKKRGESGLGGEWDRMRGVKRVQMMCKKMGSKRMRREEAARQVRLVVHRKPERKVRLAWNDDPTTSLEVIPKPPGFG